MDRGAGDRSSAGSFGDQRQHFDAQARASGTVPLPRAESGGWFAGGPGTAVPGGSQTVGRPRGHSTGSQVTQIPCWAGVVGPFLPSTGVHVLAPAAPRNQVEAIAAPQPRPNMPAHVAIAQTLVGDRTALADYVYDPDPSAFSLATEPDVVREGAENSDEDGKPTKRKPKRRGAGSGKKETEKLRRDAFKHQLNQLVASIPGLSDHAQTKKSVIVCSRDYIEQLKARERALRAQLAALKLREDAVTDVLNKLGVAIDEEDLASRIQRAAEERLESVLSAVDQDVDALVSVGRVKKEPGSARPRSRTTTTPSAAFVPSTSFDIPEPDSDDNVKLEMASSADSPRSFAPYSPSSSSTGYRSLPLSHALTIHSTSIPSSIAPHTGLAHPNPAPTQPHPRHPPQQPSPAPPIPPNPDQPNPASTSANDLYQLFGITPDFRPNFGYMGWPE